MGKKNLTGVIEETKTKEGLHIALFEKALRLSDSFGNISINEEDIKEFDKMYKKFKKNIKK